LTVGATGPKNGAGSIHTPEGSLWLDKYEAYRDACFEANENLFEQFFGNANVRIGCVIMASGESRRFGENKLLTPFDGKAMIQHIIDAAKDVFAELVIVTRHEEIKRLCDRQGVRVVLHNYPGRNDTIRLGLEALGDELDACVFCPADQPFITSASLRQFKDAVASDKNKIYRAASGDSIGSPVCFPSWAFDELKNLPEGKGGGVVISEHKDKMSFVEVSARELIDIDTKEDYGKCIQLINKEKDLIIVRGAGDVATGTICRLVKAGFPVLLLETDKPSAIRRNVAFSEAVFQGVQTVEGIDCYLAKSIEEVKTMIEDNKLVLMVDPSGTSIQELKPQVVIDGILAKRNLGTSRSMAPITIALGPGFTAGEDVDAVIETQRGHNLGRVIYEGSAAPNTGIPGDIEGFSRERVIYSPAEGVINNECEITDIVSKGDIIAYIENGDSRVPVNATMDGILRGLIRNGYYVREGLKIADIDPRIDEYNNCMTVSDKARCIAGGVLEAIMYLKRERGL
ncbi:MAG: EF2563 family selenium-dependent molybdenum hydroxylase system protein, partial [Clostridiales bacterium]|nr:EF2563 family selenium-dependent molybdenum hydroxylase system protein [Candidatus Crickella merdequi]